MSQRVRFGWGVAVRVARVLAGGVLVAAVLVAPGAAVAEAGASTYLVQLAAEPVADYRGGVPGLPATRPSPGSKIDTGSTDVRRYLGHLAERRAAVLAAVPGVRPLYEYSATFAGFAARLTGAQVAALAHAPGVTAVIPNGQRTVATLTTPEFLGLSGGNGVWASHFGGPAGAGDGVIIADVDTGLWPENPSFAALPPSAMDRKVTHRFHGTCDPGIELPSFTCNNKVIGGRYFVRGLGVDNTVRREYLSPRDAIGHGSHTASTAAGDFGVTATVDGRALGTVSGMAPAARIAVYKACWLIAEPDQQRCSDADVVAAVDAAVSDGVDILNFSISGPRTSTVDPVELAFFRAAEAGVFVAAAAGNEGPSVTTVGHDSPWVTTVAAGTHPGRSGTVSVTLGDGRVLPGVGIGPALPASPAVLAASAVLPDAPPAEATRCYPGRLDPAKVAGKIVVCDGGGIPRPEKSRAVRDVGGVGMILANPTPGPLKADLHFVPTAHVDAPAGAELKAYIAADPAPTIALGAAVPAPPAPAPKVWTFSARGPALAGAGDLLKPDLMAPGVDIIAAVAPPGDYGREWDVYSGTSMAAPHVSGVAALLAAEHPRWSPMAIKSALMTTASVTDTTGAPITAEGGDPAGPRDYGAGEITPARAFNPGLVYDSSPADWIRYLCGTRERTGAECDRVGGAIDPSDLNTPSISVGALAGAQTITRTVTSVAAKTRTYEVGIEQPPGVEISVAPSRFTIAPKQSQTFTVTMRRTSAAFGVSAFGALTWADGSHRVRSPIAVRPMAIVAPAEVDGAGASGSLTLPIGTGYDGTLTASVAGLVPSEEHRAHLANPSRGASFPTKNPAATEHTAKFTVATPAGTRLLRLATFDADHPAGTDVDIYVYRAGTATPAGSSVNGVSDEVVNIGGPSGSYDVYVEFRSGAGESVEALLHSWALGAGPTGNTVADPPQQQATDAGASPVTVRWSDLEPHRRWLGRLLLGDGGLRTATTVLRISS